MNERIQQLAKEAKEHALGAMIKITDKEQALKVYSESYDTKYTELIVRECMAQIEEKVDVYRTDVYDIGYDDGLTQAVETIKEHFGVKE
jgi:hypothetical protein